VNNVILSLNKIPVKAIRLKHYNTTPPVRRSGLTVLIVMSLVLSFMVVFSMYTVSIDDREIKKANITHIPIFRNLTVPQDDSFVNEQQKNSNYGDINGMTLKESTGTKDMRIFLKWNFSLLPIGDWDIVNVTFGINRWQVDADCDGAMIGIRGCYDDTWNEESLTWNNQPDFTAYEISVGGGGMGALDWELFSNNTLTDYVNNSYQAGNNTVSFVVHEDRLKFPFVADDSRDYNAKEWGVAVEQPFMIVWFQESYIDFTSNPVISAPINEQYVYNVTGKFWGADLNMTSTAIWLIQEFDSYNLTGVPQITHVGIYLVNLTLYYNGTTVYQNYTIGVMVETGLSETMEIVIYVLFFILLLIISFIGFKWNIPIMNLLAVIIGFSSLVAILSLFENLIIIPLTIVIIMCFLLIKTLKY